MSPTYSQIGDKDIRLTNYVVERDASGAITSYAVDASEAVFPKRLWRSRMSNLASRVDVKMLTSCLEKLPVLVRNGYVIKSETLILL